MKRRTRKEVTYLCFKGISKDGGFIFKAANWNAWNHKAELKMVSYSNGVAEIAFDYKVSIPRVAELVAGMFSEHSEFANVDSVILSYRNISLKITRDSGRKKIITMIMKAMARPEYKTSNNNITVDTIVCNLDKITSELEYCDDINTAHTKSYKIDEILEWSKLLCFQNLDTENLICISSIKDGIIEVEDKPGDTIDILIDSLKHFFIPYSNVFGTKGIEAKFNGFAIKVDDRNIDEIRYLYNKALTFMALSFKEEMQGRK